MRSRWAGEPDTVRESAQPQLRPFLSLQRMAMPDTMKHGWRHGAAECVVALPPNPALLPLCALPTQVRLCELPQGAGSASVSKSLLGQHYSRAHKLALDPLCPAHCFYSCGEDGLVRRDAAGVGFLRTTASPKQSVHWTLPASGVSGRPDQHPEASCLPWALPHHRGRQCRPLSHQTQTKPQRGEKVWTLISNCLLHPTVSSLEPTACLCACCRSCITTCGAAPARLTRHTPAHGAAAAAAAMTRAAAAGVEHAARCWHAGATPGQGASRVRCVGAWIAGCARAWVVGFGGLCYVPAHAHQACPCRFWPPVPSTWRHPTRPDLFLCC